MVGICYNNKIYRERNQERTLSKMNDSITIQKALQLLQEDVGGTAARTLLFDAASGDACVRSYGKADLIF